jgi:DNA-directed RNA polymerase beta subunit
MATNDIYSPDMKTTFYGRILQDIQEKDGFSANIIENYNNETRNKIPNIIKSTKINTDNGEITFENVHIKKPFEKIAGKNEPLTPMMSRHKQTPYFARIYATVVFKPKPIAPGLRGEDIYNPGDVEERKDNFELGSIPCMLGSELCHLTKTGETKEEERLRRVELGECYNDPLGYFIVKSERVIIIQEQLRTSTFLMYPREKNGPVEGMIVCPNPEGTLKVWMNVTKHQCVRINLQHLKKQTFEGLPIFMLFQILGFTPNEALERIYEFTNPQFKQRIYFAAQASLAEFAAIPVTSIEDCLEYVLTIRRKLDDKNIIVLEQILSDIHRDLFANITDVKTKITHLAMYCAKMFEFMIGERTLDDRDSWANKQLVTAGFQISKLFKTIWIDMIKNIRIKSKLMRGLKAVTDNFTAAKIHDNFVTAFGPNKWGLAGRKSSENITDALKRATPIEVYAQITRVTFAVNRQSKSLDVRLIHPSQLGYLCLYESPEGEGIGIVKNLATSCYISLERDPEVLYQMFKEDGILGLFVSSNKENIDQIPLMINGIIHVWCNSDIIMPELKRLRREGVIHKDVCLFYNQRDNTVEIYCDNGRPTRPLFVVDDNHQLRIVNKKLQNASLEILVREGCIEYIDAREQEYILVSQTYDDCQDAYKNLSIGIETTNGLKIPKYTHCEIDPSCMFSICAGLMPMANRNAGPRINFQAGMFRQALNQYNSSEHNRFDATYKMLHYPTKPLFQTDIHEVTGMNSMPAGQTAHVAILAHSDNPEDGIVIKEEAIKYGNFLDMCKKQTVQSVASSKNQKEYIEEFQRPSTAPGEPGARYEAIEENGLPKLDSYIRQGDCIIGKVRIFFKDGTIRNISEFTGIGGEGYVDRVLITTNSADQRVIRVKLRKNRKYIPGDKMALRYSQKGTIAKIIPARLLPRVKDGPNKGMVPDVLINPHSLPSRMTNNLLIEMKVSKAAAITGHFFNATTFRNFDSEMEYAEKTLSDYGLDMHGKENFILPNGNDLRVKVFFGPAHYQALRHHVADKIQMRARGSVTPQTHQPMQGRSKEGGLKVGEMERDALISHGGSALLKERMCEASDAYNLPICGTCGNIAITDHINKVYTCKVCGDKATFGIVRIPYVIKLLMYYLNAAGVHMTFKTENMIGNIKRPEELYLY